MNYKKSLFSLLINKYNLVFALLLAFIFSGISQVKPKIIDDKSGKLITIRHAKRLAYDQSLGTDARRLIGDVECEHEGAVMRCDSAYLFSDKKLIAYGHISIIKGDSIFVYGDSLRYDATTKLANMKGNVRCIERDMTLTTNTLIYDVGKSVASYYDGGKIVNKENTLTSKNGHYYSSNKELTFHYDVVLVNPDYKMRGDTLRYNTINKTSYFLGPSIITSKENYIYCENGWYDTENEIARFSKNAIIVNENQKLLGDSIYYNRRTGYSSATKNVQIIDTTSKNNSIITGDFAQHFDKGNKAIVTGNAVYAKVIEKDTLFMAADTLLYEQPDSVHTFVKAYQHVKFFKKDLQGLCDSLTYLMHDSLMTMYNSPILWTNNGQVTAKLIKVTIGEKSVKYFELLNNAIVIQKVDSLDAFKFNQVEGKKIEGFFANDSIRKLNVINNAQIIYYVKQKNSYKGVNKTICTDLTVWFNGEGVDRTTFRNKPESTIFPLKDVNDEEMRLKHFSWMENKRPKKKSDILIR